MQKEKFKRFCGYQIDYDLYAKIIEAKNINPIQEIKLPKKIKTTYGIESIRR